MMLARMRRNQTGIESKRIRWGQVREAVLDYKTVSVALQVIRWMEKTKSDVSLLVDVLCPRTGRKYPQWRNQ